MATHLPPAFTPNQVDVDRHLRQFTAQPGTTGYAYACGALIANLELIAEAHQRCRKTVCVTCESLRRAAAVMTAIDTNITTTPGGDW